MIVVINKQDEVGIYECESGSIAIESDVEHLGKQVIYLTPENAITLGKALIDFAESCIRLSNLADEENQENS